MYKKITEYFKENRIQVILAIAAIFVAFLPLFTENCIYGHDTDYHLLRIEALKEGILAGKPFAKVNLLFFGGRGYASSLFYPDFLLYFPAVLRAVGVSINASLNCFAALCILLSFAAMYISVYFIATEISLKNADGNGEEITSKTVAVKNSQVAAMSAAICYILAQYHLEDIYTRGAVGEYTGMIFIPFLIYGLYELCQMRFKRPWMMAAGFIGLLLCHTISTVFMIGIYTCFFAIAIVKSIVAKDKTSDDCADNKKALATLGITAVFVAAATAFYYVPVLEQLTGAAFQTDAGGFDMAYESLLLRDVFASGYKGLGVLLPIAVFVMALYLCSKDRKMEFAGCCMAVSAIAVILSTKLIPWGRLQRYLGFIQFPWRFMIIATAFLCVAGGLLAGAIYKAEGYSVIILLTAIMLVSAIMGYEKTEQQYYSYSDDYYSYIPFTGNVIGGEWLPAAADDRSELLENCDIAIGSNGESLQVERQAGSLTLTLSDTEKEYIDVPFIFYKGYKAVISDADSNNTVCRVGEGANGNTRVYLDGKEGSLKVYYAGTAAQMASLAVSLIAYVLALVFGVKKCSRNTSGAGELK